MQVENLCIFIYSGYCMKMRLHCACTYMYLISDTFQTNGIESEKIILIAPPPCDESKWKVATKESGKIYSLNPPPLLPRFSETFRLPTVPNCHHLMSPPEPIESVEMTHAVFGRYH